MVLALALAALLANGRFKADMNYIKNLYNAFRGKSSAIVSGGAVHNSIVNKPYHANRAYNELIKKNISWVYAFVDRNSKTVSDQCLRLYAKKPSANSKSRFPSAPVSDSQYKYMRTRPNLMKFVCQQQDIEEITDHPFLEVLLRGGGHYVGYDLSYLLTSSLDTTGNGYWLKETDATKTVTDIWPLLPQLVTPVPDKSNFLSHYEYGLKNQKQRISRDKMVHYKYASLKHPFLGSGPLEAGVEAADLNNAMNEYEVAMFRNGGTPDVKFTYPQGVHVDADEKKRIQKEYNRKFSQPHNAGRMITLTEGADVASFSISPKEMSYLKGRQWSREELAAIFGVPLSFVMLDGVRVANVKASTQLYMRMTIKPKLTVIEQTMNEQLVPDFDENLFVAFDNPVPEDEEFRLKQITTKINTKYASVNELRAEDGLDPVPWGDKPVEPEPIEAFPAKGKKKVKAKFPPLQMPAANFIPEEFTAAMVDFFQRQGKAVLNQAEDAEFKGVKIAEDIVGPWFDMPVWDKELAETVRPFVRASILTAGQRAMDNIGPDRFFNASDPRLFQAMESRIPSIRGINRTTLTLVRNTVADGIAGGLSGSKIRSGLRVIFEDVVGEEKAIASKRAVLIARTETIWAFNEGATIAYQQSGVVSDVEWLTAEDERVCQWCGPMDGRIQTLGTNFWDMGTEMEGDKGGILRFTAEPIVHPPLHPQCRCAIAPIV